MLAHTFLPQAQVQLVHTIHTGERVNGADADACRASAELFARLGNLVLGDYPTPAHLVDPATPPDIDPAVIAKQIANLPAPFFEKLHASRTGRGDPALYVAAHLQLHDTAAPLQPLRPGIDAPPILPKRIISIGAQSERPFYAARMACRQAGLVPAALETGQLFTRHIIPPYYPCREGEPGIDALRYTYPLRHPLEWSEDPLYAQEHPNPSVRRDLAFVARFLQGQEDPEIQAYERIIRSLSAQGEPS